MRSHSGRLWYGEPNALIKAIDYAKSYSRSHDAVIRDYDGWQCDRNARTQGVFQRVLKACSVRLFSLNELRHGHVLEQASHRNARRLSGRSGDVTSRLH